MLCGRESTQSCDGVDVLTNQTQYAYQTAAFLNALEGQIINFDGADPVRCLVHNKIESLYLAYDVSCQSAELFCVASSLMALQTVAALVYGGDRNAPKNIQGLISAFFPDPFPIKEWTARFGTPKPGQCIREFIATHDIPLIKSQNKGGNPFARDLKRWACTDKTQCPDNKASQIDANEKRDSTRPLELAQRLETN